MFFEGFRCNLQKKFQFQDVNLKQAQRKKSTRKRTGKEKAIEAEQFYSCIQVELGDWDKIEKRVDDLRIQLASTFSVTFPEGHFLWTPPEDLLLGHRRDSHKDGVTPMSRPGKN